MDTSDFVKSVVAKASDNVAIRRPFSADTISSTITEATNNVIERMVVANDFTEATVASFSSPLHLHNPQESRSLDDGGNIGSSSSHHVNSTSHFNHNYTKRVAKLSSRKLKPGSMLERGSHVSAGKGKTRSSLSHSGISCATSSPDDVILQQKKGVIIAIKEAKRAEIKRAKLLALIEDDKSKSWKVKELNERYDKERARDQLRIQQLLEDYQAVQRMNESGRLKSLVDSRNTVQLNPAAGNESLSLDKFKGMTTAEGLK